MEFHNELKYRIVKRAIPTTRFSSKYWKSQIDDTQQNSFKNGKTSVECK
jgi:hypothetical protein